MQGRLVGQYSDSSRVSLFQQAQTGANRRGRQERSQGGEGEEPAVGVYIRCTLTLPTVNKASSSRQTPFVIYNTKLLLSALIKA